MFGVCRSLVMEKMNRSEVMEKMNRSDIRHQHSSTKLLFNTLSEESRL